MDFLSKLDDATRQKEQIECLKRKKLKLQQQLKNLENDVKAYGAEKDTSVRQQTTASQYLQIIDAYRYLGVSLKHPQVKEDSIILKFDPLYKSQGPSNDSCFQVEIKKTSDGHRLGQHNLPPFIPTKQLETTHLDEGKMKEFVQEIQNYLQCYIQRNESVKQVKVEYVDHGIRKVEADLPITYVKFEVDINQDWPNITIMLHYDLSKFTPRMVSIETDDSVSLSGRERDKLNRLLSQWKTKFIQQDLYTAFTEMFQYI